MDDIEEILNAPNHYAVLGVKNGFSAPELRSAYLTKSVKVHPDKNSDPRATEAFQRVAEAWNVLSDKDARAKYDESLRNPFGEGNIHYTPPPAPSFQEALFAFAAATTMMGGKFAAAGDVAQTMFWAEKLVEGRQSRGSTANTAHAAMAVGSGLRAVGAAAKMLGFRKTGAFADRTAGIAQTVGMGAMVADVAKDMPAVKKALEKGGAKARVTRDIFSGRSKN